MDTIFMNSKNGKPSHPHRPLLNLSNMVPCQILAFTIRGKI